MSREGYARLRIEVDLSPRRRRAIWVKVWLLEPVEGTPEGSVIATASGDSVALRIDQERLSRLEGETSLAAYEEARRLRARYHQLFVTAPTPEARAEVLRRIQALEELMEALRGLIE